MDKLTKVLTIMGTRPEIIKLAPVVIELESRKDTFISRVCATGQHRQMMEQAADTFGIKPDYDLDIMAPNQTLAQITSKAIERLEDVVTKESPDIIIVQGDTTTAFCGALAAYYHQIPVGHVEAGLRTGEKYAPFPEEVNRALIGRIADFHFAPTSQSKEALLIENVPENQVFVTGNTVIDSLRWVRDKVTGTLPEEIPDDLPEKIAGKRVVLVTGHRRESFGGGFENICASIRQVADKYDDVAFVYPVHMNPNVRKPVFELLDNHPRIHLIEPLSYEPFVWMMDQSTIVLTDSGGVQEEAPSLGKPVLVMRETTERPEGVEAGNALLVGTDIQKITSELGRLLESKSDREAMGQSSNPYGEGDSARKIVDILEDRL